MSIKRKLQLTIMTVLCAGGIISLAVIIAARQMDGNLVKVCLYADLVRKISALDTLKTDYLINPKARAIEQWQRAYDSLGILLGKIQTEDVDEKSRVNALIQHYQELKQPSSRLFAADGASGSSDAVREDLQERLNRLLSVKFSVMFGEVSRLTEENQTKIVSSQKTTNLAAIVVVMTMLVLSGCVLLLTSQKITRSVLKLCEATFLISSGDLHQRVEIEGADEIAKLGESFNVMAQHLSHSHSTLEAEIAERRHAEEEVQKLNQELEQRVADRTAQLEAANQELDAFAFSVSHDLRAPLRHIDGFLDLLQKGTATTLDKRSQHYMTSISDATRRMGTLIDDLLSFSRMGRYEMFRMQVDLRALAQEVILEIEPEAGDRAVRWRVADLPVVTGDRAMLRIVLNNLISNALKYTRPRPQAEIEIGCIPGRGTETVVFIRDNGVGFDMNYAAKLFGVFQRLHRTEEFEGTGIGLANVRRIINRHGGRTWAEGTVDQGATFYFSLPKLIQGA